MKNSVVDNTGCK